MTRDDIIRMAREADLTYTPQAGWVVGSVQRLEAFATFVAAHEREACAELCDKLGAEEYHGESIFLAYRCSDAIRARGET